MPKPRLLDLFCGAGGASMGYHRAGFEVVGVDIEPQPHYPFEFWQADALATLRWRSSGFDAIHASPPCQAYSTATKDRSAHPDLVGIVRSLLEQTGVPWAIENVPNAPMRWGLNLCGGMFDLEIRRHRTFELPFMVLQPHHRCPVKPWEVTGHAGGHNRLSESHRKYRDTAHAKELMGMPWCQTSREVTEAIPPAYTEFIGAQLLQHLRISI
jgi:DNA (cytosine-5)-methyltransferase 1